MSELGMQEKWDAIYRSREIGAPARVLMENAHLLPRTGSALEIACGLGANALLLAESGLAVEAWDVSSVAIAKLQALAAERRLPLRGLVTDAVQHPPRPNSFDVIVVSHFLERTLMPALIAALRPAGLLFYQTFSRLRVDDSGPRNEAFRLADNELLTLCKELRILVYREEGTAGDASRGFRNLAMLVGQRR